MEEMKHDKNQGILCPWCPPQKKFGVMVPVTIQECCHNPFKLAKRVRELEREVSDNMRASVILHDLREWFATAK
jgi:hypothetical protein